MTCDYSMKKLISCFAVLLAGAAVFAQPDTVYVWNKWCARKDTLLLFSAANNLIQVYARGMKPDEIKLKSLDATALRIGSPEIKGDTLSVMAMPYPEKCKNKNMRLAITHKKTGKVIKTVNFNCAAVPPLEARLGKIQAKEAFRAELLNQSAMFCVFPNSLYAYPYRIRQFVFKMTTPGGSANLPVAGIFITPNIAQQIKEAPVGTVLEFTGIKAVCPDCAVRDLTDLKIKIKG